MKQWFKIYRRSHRHHFFDHNAPMRSRTAGYPLKLPPMTKTLHSVMVAACVASCLVTMIIMVRFSPAEPSSSSSAIVPARCAPSSTPPIGSDDNGAVAAARNLQQPPQLSPVLPMWFDTTRPIYLHIHMAKTAGTEHNGILADRYERVCGHKGYSYDAYKANERYKASGSIDVNNHKVRDIYSTYIHKGYGRHRVPPEIMNEIGYEDCDYISNELGWTYWTTQIPLRRYALHNISVEFHIPCRDPIEHLMSQCNYMGVTFQCGAVGSTTLLSNEIQKCVIEMDRFSYQLLNHFDRLKQPMTMGLQSSYRCFNAIPFEPYLDYMGQRLQPKRIVSSDYGHHSSNTKRNKNSECIWQQTKSYQDTVRQLLIKRYDYYRFCDSCLGTENDLFRNISTTST